MALLQAFPKNAWEKLSSVKRLVLELCTFASFSQKRLGKAI
jgi:hypothetical protein